MINTTKPPVACAKALKGFFHESFQTRLHTLTPEEQFYCLKLLKISGHGKNVTPGLMKILVLRLRVTRYLLGKDLYLFTQREWDSLATKWQTEWIAYMIACLEASAVA